MRARTMVSVAVSACVAMVACACGPEKSKENTDTKPSQPSASTRTNVPSATPSATPSVPAPTEKPSATPTGAQPAPKTKERAIQRYEQYLHALGREDIHTVCEVAGPGAKKAEEKGFGPCTSTYVIVFQMISPAQKKILRTATVDPQRVSVRTPDKIEMPVESVRPSGTFSESDLGNYTLEYLKNDWYITDGT
ncbi:hypothetical protein G3I60_11670 [Streptomyces sp. SID13666]|uniref:hypothetical protein n=1 Tax=unclassified Streptomyces TaxID=2593676 RepID=UPI0013C26C55|nr:MULTISPECIES: hypothetical protein [unclassified Streptomyces]NEA54784.1 hypothetical protein [Streptomyces sp. SID13666]NEA70574.1 hypothetical protein [Streptomyces sp. SID13588]